MEKEREKEREMCMNMSAHVGPILISHIPVNSD